MYSDMSVRYSLGIDWTDPLNGFTDPLCGVTDELNDAIDTVNDATNFRKKTIAFRRIQSMPVCIRCLRLFLH